MYAVLPASSLDAGRCCKVVSLARGHSACSSSLRHSSHTVSSASLAASSCASCCCCCCPAWTADMASLSTLIGCQTQNACSCSFVRPVISAKLPQLPSPACNWTVHSVRSSSHKLLKPSEMQVKGRMQLSRASRSAVMCWSCCSSQLPTAANVWWLSCRSTEMAVLAAAAAALWNCLLTRLQLPRRCARGKKESMWCTTR